MSPRRATRGFTTAEMLVGMVVGALVLAGTLRLWKTHQVEGWRLGKKIDLRSQMTLSSKRIDRAVTLAGLGLAGTASLAKDDAVGSDTLSIFANLAEDHCDLLSDVSHYASLVRVVSPTQFSEGGYVALRDSAGGEVRKVTRVEGTSLVLQSPFSRDFRRAGTTAFPATRQRIYSNQGDNSLVFESNGNPQVLGRDLRNFQVSFRNRQGAATENPGEVRAVAFSFTGVFPAKAGAINSIVYSSTAIPRNIQ